MSAIYSKRSTVSREIASGLAILEGKVHVSSRVFEGDEFSIGGERRVDVWDAMVRGVQGRPLLGSVGPEEARQLMLSITQSGQDVLEGTGDVGRVVISSDAFWLLKEISEPITMSRLRTRAGVGENIRGLIWLLESVGLIDCSIEKEAVGPAVISPRVPNASVAVKPVVANKIPDPPALQMDLPEMIETPTSTPVVQDLGVRPNDPVEGLRWEYAARMGSDYYGFLGMDESSSAIDLVKECRKLMQRLHGAQRSNTLPEDVEQMVSGLLAALTRVFSTFSDQRRKDLYDVAMANGEAEVLEKSASISSGAGEVGLSSTEQARSFSPPSQDQESWGFWKKGKS